MKVKMKMKNERIKLIELGKLLLANKKNNNNNRIMEDIKTNAS